MSDNKTYRIKANVQGEEFVDLNLNINQDIDMFELLSLKIGSENVYRFHTADYGCVAGRVLANNSVGVPNVKLSIFIEADEETSADSVLSYLYPYGTTSDVNEDKIKYNLLPEEKLFNCHQNVGTFPSKRLVLDDRNVFEIFDKYYKFTTTTNSAGDYMIFGVPTGSQTLHMDVDLSDIGDLLSQKPYDFMYKGHNITEFESSTMFKKDTNLNTLSQLMSQDESVNVHPFWGDPDEMGEVDSTGVRITRKDINLNYKFEPTCVFMGSLITDEKSNGFTKTCTPTERMGKMDRLTTGEGTIEMIRKTPDGDVESFNVMGSQLIDGNGTWCYQIPMNLDYVRTDEYGNIVPTSDIEKGIPTRTRVRFRVSLNDFSSDYQNNHLTKVLVPNNPQEQVNFSNEEEVANAKSNYFAFGTYTPEDEFRDLFWNKVYSVKSYIPRLQKSNMNRDKRFSGVKAVNVNAGNNPIPYNNMRINITFLFILQCAIMHILIWIAGVTNQILYAIRSLLEDNSCTADMAKDIACVTVGDGACPDLEGWYFAPKCNNVHKLKTGHTFLGSTSIKLQTKSTDKDITDEKSIDAANNDNDNSSMCLTNNINYFVQCIEMALAQEYEVIQFDFYNDWMNGMLYIPRWFGSIRKKRSYLFNLIQIPERTYACMEGVFERTRRYTQQCALEYGKENGIYTKVITKNGCADNENKQKCHRGVGRKFFKVKSGFVKREKTTRNEYVYYFKPCDWNGGKKVNYFATDIILLGSLSEHDIDGIPQTFKALTSSSYQMPTNLATTNMDVMGRMYGNTTNGSLFCAGTIVSGVTVVPDTFTDYANWGSSQDFAGDGNTEGLSNDEYEYEVTEMAGIDWGYAGPGQTRKIGKTKKDSDSGGGDTGGTTSCKNALMIEINTILVRKGGRDRHIDTNSSWEDFENQLRWLKDYTDFTREEYDFYLSKINDCRSRNVSTKAGTRAMDTEVIPIDDEIGHQGGGGGGTSGSGSSSASNDKTATYENALFQPGGHFLGIACFNAESNIKSCVNLSRACEMGASLSQRVRVIRHGEDPSKENESHAYLVPTGLISKDEILDENFRTEFATLNHNGLRVKKNPLTSRYEYDFITMKPTNFDGALNDQVKNTAYNDIYGTSRKPKSGATDTEYTRTIEDNSVDYYNFRLGLEKYSKSTQTICGKYLFCDGKRASLPMYNNSYYFYFGLHDGSTALDRFYKDFFAPCPDMHEGQYVVNVITQGAILCGEKGSAKIYISGMEAVAASTFTYTIENTDTGEIIDYRTVSVDTTEISINNLVAGDYSITITIAGYEDVVEKFTIASIMPSWLVDVTLDVEPFTKKKSPSTTADTEGRGYIIIRWPVDSDFHPTSIIIPENYEDKNIVGQAEVVTIETEEGPKQYYQIIEYLRLYDFTYSVMSKQQCSDGDVEIPLGSVYCPLKLKFDAVIGGTSEYSDVLLADTLTYSDVLAIETQEETWWETALKHGTPEQKFFAEKAITFRKSMANHEEEDVDMVPANGVPPYTTETTGYGEKVDDNSENIWDISISNEAGPDYDLNYRNFYLPTRNIPSGVGYHITGGTKGDYSAYFRDSEDKEIPEQGEGEERTYITLPSIYKPFFFRGIIFEDFVNSAHPVTSYAITVANGTDYMPEGGTLSDRFNYFKVNGTDVSGGTGNTKSWWEATGGDETKFPIYRASGDTIIPSDRKYKVEIKEEEPTPEGARQLLPKTFEKKIVFVGDSGEAMSNEVRYFVLKLTTPEGVHVVGTSGVNNYANLLRRELQNKLHTSTVVTYPQEDMYLYDKWDTNGTCWGGSCKQDAFVIATDPEHDHLENGAYRFSPSTDMLDNRRVASGEAILDIPNGYDVFVLGIYDPWTPLDDVTFNYLCNGNTSIDANKYEYAPKDADSLTVMRLYSRDEFEYFIKNPDIKKPVLRWARPGTTMVSVAGGDNFEEMIEYENVGHDDLYVTSNSSWITPSIDEQYDIVHLEIEPNGTDNQRSGEITLGVKDNSNIKVAKQIMQYAESGTTVAEIWWGTTERVTGGTIPSTATNNLEINYTWIGADFRSEQVYSYGEWVRVSRINRSYGHGTVTLTVDANEGGERSTVIHISAQDRYGNLISADYTLTQSAGAPSGSIEWERDSVSVDANGGSIRVNYTYSNIDENRGVFLERSTTSRWVTATNFSGLSTPYAEFTIEPNTGHTARRVYFYVWGYGLNGETVESELEIVQEDAPIISSIEWNADSLNVASGESTTAVSYTYNNIRVEDGTWVAIYDDDMVTTPTWVTATNISGSSFVSFEVEPNTGNTARHTNVEILARGLNGVTVHDAIVLTQARNNANLVVSPLSLDWTFLQSMLQQNIGVTGDTSYTATTDNNYFTISPTTGTGVTNIVATPAGENTWYSNKVTNVAITDGMNNFSVTLTQGAAPHTEPSLVSDVYVFDAPSEGYTTGFTFQPILPLQYFFRFSGMTDWAYFTEADGTTPVRNSAYWTDDYKNTPAPWFKIKIEPLGTGTGSSGRNCTLWIKTYVSDASETTLVSTYTISVTQW